MICSTCGCTDLDPCIDEEGQPCTWVAPSLCSACVTDEDLAGAGEAVGPEPGFCFDEGSGLWLPS